MPLHESALRLLRALPDPAVLLTPQGDLLAANRAARDTMARTAGGEVRPGDAFPVAPEGAEAFVQLLRQWSRTTEPTPGSFLVASASDPVMFSARGAVVSPGTDAQPAVLFVRFWPRDEANPFLLLNQKITELHDEVARRVQVEDALRRSEAALQERVAESEALHRAKDEFLAIASHELRTPLHAILGWAEVLRRQPAHERSEKGLDVIQRNAVAQAKLVDDILDVSRIVTGKMRLETRVCDLAALLDDAVDVVRPSATAKALDLQVERPSKSCLLVADPDRISQIIWNLLSNAVKFTDGGGTVQASLSLQESQYVLEVRDQGVGIEPSFLPLVFDRFKQADSSTTRRAGGLGLGLALVRHIVELHGGSVHARSDGPGTGASFTFTLPIRAITEAAAPASPTADIVPPQPAAAAPETRSLHGVRVLVVDDEADARELLTALLTHAGGEVHATASAGEAFEALAHFSPHVLVSDIGMPDENGYSLVKRLRTSGPIGYREMPALALTAYTRLEDRGSALAAGFTAHLGKPVTPDALIAMVATLAVHAPERATRKP
ncbi:ATP-binding protein [Luteitalea sp.]|uniref:ATP-binding response regulator n=1 Tax=Luteitalea sp. TaxID=2004800 RepID=UPI000AFFC76C|nr:ATP-binding protein [Luteitalea sp.]